ncbi:MAG: M48 family metalloprotease [Mariprofundus sp.]
MIKQIHILLLIVTLAGCATNPATKTSDFVMMSEAQELKIGQQAAAEVAKQLPLLSESDPLVAYVDRVGQKVAATADRPELFYRFAVVDNATINAFALPGGYIYIHRGLLNHMNSEAELAAVLGHEIGHVTARHAVQQYTKAQAYQLGMAVTSIFVPVPYGSNMITDLVAMAVIKGYGREAESQSDELAITYLSRAGYDPQAVSGILQTLKRLSDLDNKEKKDAGDKVEEYHGAFASHPETEKRIHDVIARYSDTQQSRGLIHREAMLSALEGYPYGDSPEQGAIIGQRFIHPDMGIQLRFPDDWVITNTPSVLQARLRKQKVYFMMQLKELSKRQTPEEVLRATFPDRKMFGIVSRDPQAGMDHAQALIRMSAPHVSQAMIQAHVFLKGRQAFLLSMWSQRDTFELYRNQFASIARSFRPYNKQRDGDVPRIKLYRWQAGDSWQRLAGKSHQLLGRFSAERLAALNGMNRNEQPAIGVTIKYVQ